MKLKNNWTEKSLDSLERINTPTLNKDEGSYLLNTCNQLRKKQLKDFEIEDLRIMIGQSNGLDYLIILAIEILKEDILSEGHFYEGDLLKAVLTSDKEYWKNNPLNWEIVCDIFESNTNKLKEFDTTWEIRKGWFDSYKEFKNIN